MMKQSYLLLISLFIILIFLLISHLSKNNIEQFDKNLIVNKTIIEKQKHFTDYLALSNGSLDAINDILQNVIDNNNSRLITFNPGFSPVIKTDINNDEINDYGQFLVLMMNKFVTYEKFYFIDVEPEYKIKTNNQTKMKFNINVKLVQPEDIEPILLKFAVILLTEKLYSEFDGFNINNEPLLDQLPFDIVPNEDITFIEEFTIINKK